MILSKIRRYKNRSYFRNNANGYSLITVLSLSLIATLVVSGLLAGVTPVFKAVNGDKSRLKVRNFAEAAADFTLAKLNDKNFNEGVSPSSELDAEKKTISISANELGIQENFLATVTVENKFPDKNSRLFRAALSPFDYVKDGSGNYQPLAQDWSYFSKGSKSKKLNNSWRTITSVVSFGSIVETVIIAAQIDYSVTKGIPGDAPTAFFPSAAVGAQTISMNGSSTYGYYPNTSGDQKIFDESGTHLLGGDIFANHQIIFSGSSNQVGGSLNVPSINESPSITGSSSVNRYLTANNAASDISDTNVHGYSNNSDYRPEARESNYLPNQETIAQSQIAPSPNPPTNSLSFSGSLPYSFPNTSSNFVTPSLNMASGSVETSGISVFISDTGSNGVVANIKGNINNKPSKSSTDFQIWYNGEGTIKIDPTEMKATIYAPNASVELVSSSTGKGSFKGAVVAKNLTLTNVDFGFDNSLKTLNSQKYDANQLTSASKYKAVAFRRVSETR